LTCLTSAFTSAPLFKVKNAFKDWFLSILSFVENFNYFFKLSTVIKCVTNTSTFLHFHIFTLPHFYTSTFFLF
jgi:hypothetical protein